MGVPFATDKLALRSLLDDIHSRDLALPDFQRDFVWDPVATEELLESIFSEFPTGSLLLMQHRDDGFWARPIAGAPALNGHRPQRLVLDGQQRLTSLYQALYGVGDYRYYLKLGALSAGKSIEEALFHETTKRALKLKYDTLEFQAAALQLPLSEIFGGAGYLKWSRRVRQQRRKTLDPDEEIEDELSEVHDNWIDKLPNYDYPYVLLGDQVSMVAICRIFETLNRTGVKLTVFELLAARYFAHDLRLRDKWLDTLRAFPILDEFEVDPVSVLQAISLRVNETPACQRSDLLKLSADDIRKHWDDVAAGYAGVLKMLQIECGVLSRRWLPYSTQLVPMAAVWREWIVGPKDARAGANRSRLQRWFWRAALRQDYESAANTQAEKDFEELRRWFASGAEPTAIKASLEPIPFREVTTRQRAVYNACMALIARHGPLDFHKLQPITPEAIREQQIDDHHVFPRGYLADSSELRDLPVDSVLNRTLIDKQTNIRIGKKAPATYLKEMEVEFTRDQLNELLASHLLPNWPQSALGSNDFAEFLEWRAAALQNETNQAT